MQFFGYPIEIWAAAFVSMLIRLQTSNTLTVLGAVTTIIVAVFSGVILHEPVMSLFGLADAWKVPIAIIIALSAENLMKAIVELSADKEWLTSLVRHFVDNNAVTKNKNKTKEDDFYE